MKLLQLNAWMGRLTPQILQLIEQEQPDIVTAQEVFSVDGPVIFPDNMFNCLEQMQSAGGFKYCFFSPLWSIQASHQTATMGNAILSKYSIDRQETIFTHGAYNPDLTPENRVENTRNAQFATIDIAGRTLNIANHHAHWESTPEGSDTSVERMRIIRDKLADNDGPTIFSGDLNVSPATPTLQLFDGFLEDLTGTHHVASTLSMLGKVQNVACDHILVSPEVEVLDFRVLDALVSDHFGLVLEFEL